MKLLGGGFVTLQPVACESGRVASGATGDILTVTAGAGQYLKLKHLLPYARTVQPEMTLVVDGEEIFKLGVLGTRATAESVSWGVCSVGDDVSTQNTARLLPHVFCKSFTVKIDSLNSTATAIEYVYEILEAI
jgi:hypothetical protein